MKSLGYRPTTRQQPYTARPWARLPARRTPPAGRRHCGGQGYRAAESFAALPPAAGPSTARPGYDSRHRCASPRPPAAPGPQLSAQRSGESVRNQGVRPCRRRHDGSRPRFCGSTSSNRIRSTRAEGCRSSLRRAAISRAVHAPSGPAAAMPFPTARIGTPPALNDRTGCDYKEVDVFGENGAERDEDPRTVRRQLGEPSGFGRLGRRRDPADHTRLGQEAHPGVPARTPEGQVERGANAALPDRPAPS